MYTIVMNQDKSLSKKNVTTLYQREKLIDKIIFMIPLKYGNVDISDFDVILKYTDQGNVSHAEKLAPSGELYKDILKCFCLPVDTNLTRFAGDITLRLTLSKIDLEAKTHTVLHTGETTITITPLDDYYKFVIDESLEIFDQKYAELDVKVQELHDMMDIASESQVDDLSITDDGLLQVSANGKSLGVGVKVAVPSIDDGEYDGTSDGILDLEEMKETDNSSEEIETDSPTFIEL